MKQIILISTLLLSFTGFSQPKKAAAIASQVMRLKAAMENPSEAELKELTEPQLIYGHSSGVIDSQTDFISKLVSGKSDFVSINITEQTIKIEKNTAIVRHRLDAVTNDGGKPGEAHLWVMLVWVKKGGSWKLLARQATKATY